MVVSIVRWRHLSKQVRREQICIGFVIPGYIVIYKEVSQPSAGRCKDSAPHLIFTKQIYGIIIIKPLLNLCVGLRACCYRAHSYL